MKRSTWLAIWMSSLSITGIALRADADLATPTCPVTVNGGTFSGTSLTTDCATPTATSCTVKNGIVANSSSTPARLELANDGGNFVSTQLGITSAVVFASVGDFNKDGWPDFVGAPYIKSNSALNIFQNQTWQNENCTDPTCSAYSGAAPVWNSGTAVTPKFVSAKNLHGSGYNGMFALAAGDFSGDGWDDVFELYASGGQPAAYSKLQMYVNKAANSASGCTNSPYGGCAQFKAVYDASTASTTGFTNSSIYQGDTGTNVQVVDYNGDGHLDVLIGTGEYGGSIHVLTSTCTEVTPAVFNNGLKKCATDPKFTDGGYLIRHLNRSNVYTPSGTYEGFGGSSSDPSLSGNEPVFYYGDLDSDGMKDLIVSSPNCCSSSSRRLRLFKGCAASNVPTPGTCGPNKLETTASQALTPFIGDATTILVADFSLDGKLDAIVGTDNYQYLSNQGGQSWIWKNNATSSPFAVTPTKLTNRGTGTGQSQDYDVGFVFDYDRDPQHTPDALLADGNDSGNYYILADRTSSTYVSCGEVEGTVDVGTVSSSDAVITSARLTLSLSNLSPPTRTVEVYANNSTDNASWVGPLSNCTTAPTTDYCAAFTKPVGQTLRWKAKLCTTDPYTTPSLSSVGAKFDYRNASEHYRAGVVVNDGVVYTGALRQPGERGKFYAINAGLSSGSPPYYWEAGAMLDAMSDAQRNIYTAVDGVAMAFTAANATASTAFQALLGGDATSAPALVTWAREARFGYGSTTNPLTKLGGVYTSTPAVLTKPGRPSWYSYASASERSAADSFVASKASRVPLVMFGSKDGMIHAVYTFPTDLSDARNGKEAWAYIPPTVAAGMMADKTTLEASNASYNDGLNHPVSSMKYPDGSPTLADYYDGTTMKTVSLVAEGNGGRSFSVFDVTETVDPSTGTVAGPTPMWNATPGDTDAGYGYAKPVVARVSIGGSERFIVIGATGIDPNDTTPSPATTAKGRVVTAYNLSDGSALWKFQAKCPVTSELTAFETDDALETAAPVVDGYIDRLVFADDCGYVYKLAPGVDLSGGWLANTNMGSINTGTNPGGGTSWALFATSASANLNAQRIIAGTIGARIDSSTRMILYFGTGGSESVSAGLTNHFYAIYADTGAVRSRYVGTCSGGICEKFYGGVVVTPTQVIYTRTMDPQIATNSCDDGSSSVAAYSVDASGGNFVSDFTQSLASAVMGTLFGDAGAVYYATLGGDVNRIGAPRVSSAGGDTSAGHTQGTGTGQNGASGGAGGSGAFTLVGWRVVL